ncbi:uncharacterized protein M421DRAFT_66620 [Didymella exigua CBS 183.55]|uniref:Cyclin N-terminal domain-containing protein n=1 Tax=Didymella exigua CBS 183.55 TaxID=1150837 RepID=A0A6A5RIV7_9PLEO|nr:uncharacterized protein M421DRAFT_66620 [Didymella exigua CBS 183.55]KAF1927038.1 hypothetical protein M421DRAFT_66620 [Didymella exigua CBS 183.55]
MELSPAFSITSDMTDEELDLYFASCGSLSNLPTPPPAKEHTTIGKSTSASSDLQEFAPEQHGKFSNNSTSHNYTCNISTQATHLANLVLLNASTIRPSVPGIRGILERSYLQDEVVAFAACILDTLSYRFAATWRETLLPPDILVLAALSLAHGFFSDTRRSAHYWAVGISRDQFTIQELEATKRSILHDMDYGLCRITEGMMESMLRDMQRTRPASLASETDTIKADRRRNFSIDLSGTAMWKNGVQTPEPSP